MHEERNFLPDKTPKKPSSGSTSSHYPSDPYDVSDYDAPDDFADEWAEEFGDGRYDDILKNSKQIYDFSDVIGNKPYEWFFNFLGAYKKFFFTMSKNNEKTEVDYRIKINLDILKEKNKSSIYQFLRYYPNDEILKYWSKILE